MSLWTKVFGMGRPVAAPRIRVVGMASLYEPLEFLETRIANLNQCDLSETIIYWADCSSAPTWREVRKLVASNCRFPYTLDHFEERTTLYWTWTWIARMAVARCAEYITNVNVDDLHHPEYFRRMPSFLDDNKIVQIVGCSWLVTAKKGMVWPPDAENNQRLSADMGTMGHFPMWRTSLFGEVGYFDERMLVIGDADFWDRIHSKYGTSAFGHVWDHLACYTTHGCNLYSTAKGPHGESGEAWDRSLIDARKRGDRLGDV